MLLATRCLCIISIWCYLAMASDQKRRLTHPHHHHHHHHDHHHPHGYHSPSHHDHSDASANSKDMLKALLQQRWDARREQQTTLDPCTRAACTRLNQCFRLQHRRNNTKFKQHCACLEASCPKEMKKPKTKLFVETRENI